MLTLVEEDRIFDAGSSRHVDVVIITAVVATALVTGTDAFITPGWGRPSRGCSSA